MTENPPTAAQRRAAHRETMTARWQAERQALKDAYDVIDGEDVGFWDLHPGDRVVFPEWPANPFTVRKTKFSRKALDVAGPETALHVLPVEESFIVHGDFDDPEASRPFKGAEVRRKVGMFPETTIKLLPGTR